MRQSRKLDHLKYSLSLADGPGVSGFADIALVHNCLPNLAWDELIFQAQLLVYPFTIRWLLMPLLAALLMLSQ